MVCNPLHRYSLVVLLLVSCFDSRSVAADAEPTDHLASQIAPWLDCLHLQTKAFRWNGQADLMVDGAKHSIQFDIQRFDDEHFMLSMSHQDYQVTIVRNPTETAMILPKHQRIFHGSGEVDVADHLRPTDIFKRLVSDGSVVKLATTALASGPAGDVAGALLFLSGMKPSSNSDPLAWQFAEGQGTIRFKDGTIQVRMGESQGALTLTLPPTTATSIPPSVVSPLSSSEWKSFERVAIPRDELERSLSRGVRRALEVVAPSPKLTRPARKENAVENGRLIWVDGQRVAFLWGSPEQIGTAHGQLLKQESLRCIDSVIYGFGTAQTIATGRWFHYELKDAYARLSPHIPERHKRETHALAKSLGVEPELMDVINVFPELFHCSGFAVFGSATEGGKLYHGRVLDYMTTIGLQDAATTLIIAPDGYRAFANVGYGGFIGSVSGMNDAQLSLGEMGGRGEGKWDGVPMATLMRRGLEECQTLHEIKQLWANNPRTCEYFYVFADGKNRTAVGVAATPETLEFVAPGESHPLLGDGIQDAVVISADTRLEVLKKKIVESHGSIDASIGQKLMCRPVAMASNLHNVLFVPEDGVLYVANADHQSPAADRPYVRLDMKKYLEQIREWRTDVGKKLPVKAERAPSQPLGLHSQPLRLQLEARDSLVSVSDPDAATEATLSRLRWAPIGFQVESEEINQQTLLRFPSPVETGDVVNDRVALEWYAPRNASSTASIPAVVVVHESGRGMTVGRLVAKGIANQGIHAFMVHLPQYGLRKTTGSRPPDPSKVLRQCIADVRRAYDAVAAVPGVDIQRISLQGTSLGGFIAATTAGLDDRYHRVFLLLAGGDLYSVVTDGKKDARKFREQMEELGLSESEIEQCLQAVEPLSLAHRIQPEKTWLFSGKYDDVVPPRNSLLLAKAAKLPEGHHIEMEVDHYSGVFLLPTILKDIARIARE